MYTMGVSRHRADIEPNARALPLAKLFYIDITRLNSILLIVLSLFVR